MSEYARALHERNIREARNDALEEAARVCDWLCQLESQVDSQIARHRAEATENAAVRIRGLKSQEAKS